MYRNAPARASKPSIEVSETVHKQMAELPHLPEHFFRDKLALTLNGRVQTERCIGDLGVADIVTDDEVIEVKRVKSARDIYHAMGQAMGYTHAINALEGSRTPRAPRVHAIWTEAVMNRVCVQSQTLCKANGVTFTHEYVAQEAEDQVVAFRVPTLSMREFIDKLVGTGGRPLLVVRDDGRVWVSSMLQAFDKKLANFKLVASNKVYMHMVAEELGLRKADGTLDPDQLLEMSRSPFDHRTGWWVHMDMLMRLASWIYPPLARVCDRIVTKFYQGQLTTQDSLDAVVTMNDILARFRAGSQCSEITTGA